MLCCLVARVDFQCFNELMPSTLIVAVIPENEAPDDPVVRVLRPAFELLDTLLDFLDGAAHLSSLEEGKGPMPVASA